MAELSNDEASVAGDLSRDESAREQRGAAPPSPTAAVDAADAVHVDDDDCDGDDGDDAEMDGLSDLNATTVSHTVNGESQVLSGDDRDSRFDLSSPPNATTPRHDQPPAAATVAAASTALPDAAAPLPREEETAAAEREPTSRTPSRPTTPDRPVSPAKAVASPPDAAERAPACADSSCSGSDDESRQKDAPGGDARTTPRRTEPSTKSPLGTSGKPPAAAAAAKVTPAALGAANRVKTKRRDVRESRGGGSRSVHDRGLLGSQAGGHRGGGGQQALATTRLRSAAEDDLTGTMSAVSATPAPVDVLPPLADGDEGAELLMTSPPDVTATPNQPKASGLTDPYPLAPSIRSPAPRVVKLADRKTAAMRQWRHEGLPGSKHHALTPQPSRTRPAEDELNAVVATLRPVPGAEALAALTTTAAEQPKHALSPDPARRWKGLDADLSAAARRRHLEPSALRAPQALQPAAGDAVVVVQQQQQHLQINLEPLSTPQATAAALLKLQEIEAEQEARRVRSLAPLSPADARRRQQEAPLHANPLQRRQQHDRDADHAREKAPASPVRSKSSILLGGGDADSRKQPARAKSTTTRNQAATVAKPLYVPPNRRLLAPIASMPKGPDGRPLFDAKARRRELQRHAARLIGATSPPPMADPSPSPSSGGKRKQLAPLHSIATGPTPGRPHGDDAAAGLGQTATPVPALAPAAVSIPEAAEPDPIAEVVASIPLALRRHMDLPESAAMAAKRKDNELRMRRCRRETAARLRARDEAVDDTVEEARQRDVFKVQRTYRLAALAAEQQEQAKHDASSF